MGRHYEFGIGKYHIQYRGYRMVKEAEWQNSEFQAVLVQAHREGINRKSGWPILGGNIECNGSLHVAEGKVKIDGELVVEVGYGNFPQVLSGVYPAMNWGTKVAWTTMEPALGNNWTVLKGTPKLYPPCLFVKDDAADNAAAPGGGSRRSRRHKRRNYVKKQKKRTRKHYM